MKVRLDFVTNSSSSSFVCYGISKEELTIDRKIYLDAFESYCNKRYCSLKKEKIEQMSEEEKIEYIKSYSGDSEILSQGLLTCGGEENDIIGITIGTIFDNFKDAKVGDIKKLVAEEINKFFGTDFTEDDISYFEEVYYC